MLAALLGMCLPAHGEILIYRKSMMCFEADGEAIPDNGPEWDWNVDDGRVTGYLILDVQYDDNGEILEVDDAVQVEYWREGRDRFYTQIYHTLQVQRIEVDGTVYWLLGEFVLEGETAVAFMMVRGKARNINIGLGWDERREVAQTLTGAVLIAFQELEFTYTRICNASFRLHTWWTRLANDPDVGNQDFEFADFEIVKAWLEWLGYTEVLDGFPFGGA